MVDEIFDRMYRDGRDRLHDDIATAIESLRCSIVNTFDALHDVQFAAPWSERSKSA